MEKNQQLCYHKFVGKERLLTPAEAWERFGGVFKVEHFVSEPGPLDDSPHHVPVPEIPPFMKEEDADRAQEALDVCVRIAGAWGQCEYRIASPEFREEFEEASRDFLQITNLEVLDVLNLAFYRFMGGPSASLFSTTI